MDVPTFLLRATLVVCSSLPAFGAAFISPTSYVSDSAGEGIAEHGGSYDYYDDTGNQLADGVKGVDDWATDLGNGPAYEWVGWRFAEPTITFNFASSVTINEVHVGLNRDDADSIFIPASIDVGGTLFPLSPTAFPDTSRGDVVLTGNWTGSSLTVKLIDNNPNGFMFSDEIQFAAVPEPRVWGVSAGIGLLAFAWLRRRTRPSPGRGSLIGK